MFRNVTSACQVTLSRQPRSSQREPPHSSADNPAPFRKGARYLYGYLLDNVVVRVLQELNERR
eukprot:2255277-Rhodomonas_salina.2